MSALIAISEECRREGNRLPLRGTLVKIGPNERVLALDGTPGERRIDMLWLRFGKVGTYEILTLK